MRKAAALMTGLMFLIAAAGCAPSGDRHSYEKVKCPACGYEFDTPRD